jgi:16S rRNA (guanine966-N2)-methyltransferase
VRIGAGRFKGRNLPEARGARPVPGRLRTSLFSVLAPAIEGTRVLDLFAGVGGLGLEALSRGAAHVTLVERDPRAARELEAWIATVGAEREARVVFRDAVRGNLPAGPFDIVFLDPPFETWAGGEAVEVLARALGTLSEGGLVVAKVPAKGGFPGEDARWSVERRTEAGSVAYALIRPKGPSGTAG